MNGKLIRAISLIPVIVLGGAFCAFLWIGYKQVSYMIVPAVAFTGIYIWILITEVWGATTGVKKTLSTRFNHWVKLHPVLGISSLILFWLAMTALVIHLGWAW